MHKKIPEWAYYTALVVVMSVEALVFLWMWLFLGPVYESLYLPGLTLLCLLTVAYFAWLAVANQKAPAIEAPQEPTQTPVYEHADPTEQSAQQPTPPALPASDSTQYTLEANEWTQSNGLVDNPDDLR